MATWKQAEVRSASAGSPRGRKMTARGPETPDDKSNESVRTPLRMCPEAPGDDCLSLR